MKLVFPNSCLKIVLQAAVAVTLTLDATAQTGDAQTTSNLQAPFSNAELLELDEWIANLKTYLETLKLYDVNTLKGSTHAERLKSQDWLYENLAEDLVKHGINQDKLLKIADNNDTGVKEIIGPRAKLEAHFEDYFKLAEIAVIARVGDAIPNSAMTYAGPGFFNLEVTDILSATTNVDNIAVENSLNPHHRVLYKGRECVFLLSPTYTKHYILPNKDYPNLPEFLREDIPDNFLTSRFPTYCSSDGDIFSPDSYNGRHESITRSEILILAKTNPLE